MKGLRVAGAKTLEQANAYLEAISSPGGTARSAVVPVSSDDAHRPLRQGALVGRFVELRGNQTGQQRLYDSGTIGKRSRSHPTAFAQDCAEPMVRVEKRLDGSHGGAFPRVLPSGEPMPGASESDQQPKRPEAVRGRPRRHAPKADGWRTSDLTSPAKNRSVR